MYIPGHWRSSDNWLLWSRQACNWCVLCWVNPQTEWSNQEKVPKKVDLWHSALPQQYKSTYLLWPLSVSVTLKSSQTYLIFQLWLCTISAFSDIQSNQAVVGFMRTMMLSIWPSTSELKRRNKTLSQKVRGHRNWDGRNVAWKQRNDFELISCMIFSLLIDWLSCFICTL